MHRRAARTLIAALAGALLVPASAGAYTITAQPKPEGEGLVFTITPANAGEIPTIAATRIGPRSGSAKEGEDFDGTPRNATPAGAHFTVTVPTIEDNVDELQETVVLAPENAQQPSGEGAIDDDDPPPALSIADAAVLESAGAARMSVSAPNPSPKPSIIAVPAASRLRNQ